MDAPQGLVVPEEDGEGSAVVVESGGDEVGSDVGLSVELPVPVLEPVPADVPVPVDAPVGEVVPVDVGVPDPDGGPVPVGEALGSSAGASESPAGMADGSWRMMSRIRRS